jgi:N-acetylneuraminate synthase
MIDRAKAAGCDAVKFQKRTIDVVYDAEYLASPRQSPWGTTQREQKEGLELGEHDYDEIDRHCKEIGIVWFASAWDLGSQEFLRKYDLPYNKIASAMVGHRDLLGVVAGEGKPTFISTGMSEYSEIDEAVQIFEQRNCPYVLMHCVSSYPAPERDLNLRTITELRRRYGVPIGYSGHETTMVPSVLAAMMGAVAVERHITLDVSMYGSDQSSSLGSRGLDLMVSYIRTIPVVMGDGVKRLTMEELETLQKLRYFAKPLYGP